MNTSGTVHSGTATIVAPPRLPPLMGVEEQHPVCKRIQDARLRAGLSRREAVARLAEEGISISERGYFEWERYRVPNGRFFPTIARVFNVSENWLMTGEDVPPASASDIMTELRALRADVADLRRRLGDDGVDDAV